MSTDHLTAEQLDRLLQNEMQAEEARRLVWHLLDSCPQCAEVADVSWPVKAFEQNGNSSEVAGDTVQTVPLQAQDYATDESFARLQNLLNDRVAGLRKLRSEAKELMDGLASETIGRQITILKNSPKFHSLPVCEELLDRAKAVGFEEPRQAEQFAELALEIVDTVDEASYGVEVLNDLRGRAWAYRGNFRRIASDYRAAGQAFAEAERLLGKGTGDVMERARVFDLKASLRFRQERFDEAIDLTRRAITLYTGLNEDHLAGRAMLKQANIYQFSDESDKALRAIREGLALIDSEREPRLVNIGYQGLLVSLSRAGRYEEAQALIPKARRLVIELGTRSDLVRLRLTEGRVLAGLGHTDRAEAAFLEAQKGFVDAGLGFDAAQVSVELALLYARQGRTAEMKRLAQEMLPIFESRDVHQEVLAALLIFRRALEMESSSLSRVQEFAEYLRRARINPTLRFQPKLEA